MTHKDLSFDACMYIVTPRFSKYAEAETIFDVWILYGYCSVNITCLRSLVIFSRYKYITVI